MFDTGEHIILGGTIATALVAAVVAASYGPQGRRRWRDRPPLYEPSIIARVVVAVALLATPLITGLAIAGHPVLPVRFVDPSVAVPTGVVVGLLGLLMFWWAKRSLGASYAPCYDARKPQGLVRSGPYRWIRHPLYSANLTILLGATLASQSLLQALLLAALAALYFRMARREEEALAHLFTAYAEYRESTGRFLPRLIR